MHSFLERCSLTTKQPVELHYHQPTPVNNYTHLTSTIHDCTNLGIAIPPCYLLMSIRRLSYHSIVHSSLVPRPLPLRERRPGKHCVRMRQIYGHFFSKIHRIHRLPHGARVRTTYIKQLKSVFCIRRLLYRFIEGLWHYSTTVALISSKLIILSFLDPHSSFSYRRPTGYCHDLERSL